MAFVNYLYNWSMCGNMTGSAASDHFSVSSPMSQSKGCASKPRSFSKKQSATGTLVCEQSIRATMNVEGPSTMPERTPV